MKELQAKAKVTQTMTRDGLVVENQADGTVEKLDMPTTSNVLQWFCDDNTKVSVRPSGTEPKIKFYIEVKDPSFKCAGCYERCSKAADDKIEAIKKSLHLD